MEAGVGYGECKQQACVMISNGAYGENDEGEIARHAVKGAAQ